MSHENPVITIVTPSRNQAEYLPQTIGSVLGQDYPGVDFFVVDGGSTDGTADIINSMACKGKVAKWVSEPDRGVYDAMNKGIALATGDVIGFLNADDVFYDSSVVGNIARNMEQIGVDACYSDLVYVGRSDTNKIMRYWRSTEYDRGMLASGWIPAHPTFYARKALYEKYGMYDLNYSLAADYELMVRFLERHGVIAKYIPTISVKMRVGGITNTSILNKFKQNVEIFRAWRKHGIRINPAKYLAHKAFLRFNKGRG